MSCTASGAATTLIGMVHATPPIHLNQIPDCLMSETRTVDTPLLRIGYEEWNSAGAATAVLLRFLPAVS